MQCPMNETAAAPCLRRPARIGGWVLCLLLAVVSVLSFPAYAQQAEAWVDPVPELVTALQQAEAQHGRSSNEYVLASQALIQVYLRRGDLGDAVTLVSIMVATLAEVLPADDANLLQARTVEQQLREQASACGPAVTRGDTPSADAQGFQLVSQSASYDFRMNALSSDGRWLVSGANHSLVLRDVDTGLVVRQITDTPSTVTQLAFVPDSNYLVGGFTNGCLVVWDVTSGGRMAVALPPLATRLTDLAVSPDGSLIAAAYAGAVDNQARQDLVVWNFQAGGIERRFFLDDKFHFLDQPVDASLYFTPNSRGLFAYSFLNIRLWNMQDGSLNNATPAQQWIKHVGDKDDAMLQELAQSPDGRYLALRTGQAIWLLEPAEQFRVVRRFDLPESIITNEHAIRFSPDGSRVLLGPKALYAVETGEQIPLPEGVLPSWSHWLGKQKLLMSGTGGYFQVWDGAGLPTVHAPNGAWGALGTVAFANQGSLLVTDAGGQDYWDLGSLYLHDEKPDQVRFDQPVQGGMVLHVVRGLAGRNASFADWLYGAFGNGPLIFNDASGHLYSAHPDGQVRLWDVNGGEQIEALAAQPAAVTAMAVSADEFYLASASGGKSLLDFSGAAAEPASLTLLDRQSGKLLWTSRGHAGEVSQLAMTPDQRYLVSMSAYRIEVHDLVSGELLRTLANQPADGMFSAIAVNTRGQVAYVNAFGSARLDTRIVIIDLATGEQLKSYQNDSDVDSLALSPNGDLLAATQQDGVVRLWSLQTDNFVSLAERFISEPEESKTLETLFNPPREWVVYAPDGYFAAGRGGTSLVAVVRDLQVYKLDQFGLRFNRPDILLQRLKLGYPGMIEHFHQRHLSRLRQAGITEGQDASGVAMPGVEIVAATPTDGVDAVQLKLAFSSPEVDLLSYNVRVNGVPVHAGQGQGLSGRDASVQESVPLSAGDNLLEVSALAANGMESPRKYLKLAGPAAGRKPDLYFVGFGVSKYADAGLNLGYAHKDVQDLAASLGASEQFERVHQHAFTDAEVTPQAIVDAKALLATAGKDDVVVILVAGHGMHDRDAAGTYYYLTHAADPARLAETAADFSLLESLLIDIPARNRLFLLDTCESGELEPAFVTGVFDALAGKQERARTTRGLTLDEPLQVATQPDRRPYLHQRSRYIYNNLSRRNGVVMFASSAGHELSYESAEKQNGYFTEALLQVLGQSGRKDLEALRKGVRDLVIKYSEGKQHPGVYWNNLHSRLYFDPIRQQP